MIEVKFTLLMIMLVATWICGAITAYSIQTIIENHDEIEKTLNR